ncbi:adenylate/guanylate cyclase domain-containing protein [Mycolicibacterium thermoresistibile]
MTAKNSVAHRLGRLLEALTRQSGRLSGTPEYGSWLLGKVSESQLRRRLRIQTILTTFIVGANLVGIAVAVTLVSFVFPVPSIFSDAPAWLTFGVSPALIVVALVVGTTWITRGIVQDMRWAIEERPPSRTDQRNTFLAPWRVARAHLVLWGGATAVLTTLYGLIDAAFIPRYLFTVSFAGIMVATICYLFTEFALRPVAAQALEAGPPPRRLAHGIMGRTMTVWLLGSGVPLLGIMIAAAVSLTQRHLSLMQFTIATMVLAAVALVFGFLLMWLVSWLTATPVRVVRSALKQVENGNLDCNVVVFDGTELGELQSGFNAMVAGLRERERVRDLFGRHVGREVARAAEQQQLELGGEERHVAVIFVDIIGSTRLITSRPAADVVALLNRFFAVIVAEVDRHHGLVNKFEGDATLAVFGAPNRLDNPEDEALAAARGIAARLRTDVPDIEAGIGVASGQVVAGNVGARERFEYTVIGEPVNEGARLCELAKSKPSRLVASADAVSKAGDAERARWTVGETVTLRGHSQPTQLALPV